MVPVIAMSWIKPLANIRPQLHDCFFFNYSATDRRTQLLLVPLIYPDSHSAFHCYGELSQLCCSETRDWFVVSEVD